MEEIRKPRSIALLITGLLLGAAAGFFGALWGAAVTAVRGILSLSEQVLLTAAVGGLLLGSGVALVIWWIHPRRGGWGLQLIVDMLGAGISAVIVFSVVGRMMRS
jgi:hypothetical protein